MIVLMSIVDYLVFTLYVVSCAYLISASIKQVNKAFTFTTSIIAILATISYVLGYEMQLYLT